MNTITRMAIGLLVSMLALNSLQAQEKEVDSVNIEKNANLIKIQKLESN